MVMNAKDAIAILTSTLILRAVPWIRLKEIALLNNEPGGRPQL